MSSYTLFWRAVLLFSIGGMTASTLLAAWLLWRGRARPFIRSLGLALLLIYALLVVQFVRTEQTAGAASPFADWFWNLDLEYAPGTLLSTVQLVAIAGAALWIAWRWRAARIERLYWLLLGGGFLFLGLDEYFQIHETLIGVDRWRLVYALGGALLGGLTLWLWRRTRADRFFLVFGIGLGIMALAGILVEQAVFESFCYESAESLVPVCEDFDVYLLFEEAYELLGEGVVLLALLYFAQTRLDDSGWRGQKRLLLIVAPVTGLLLAAYLWLLPGLEARLATAVTVDYGDFRLLAYRVDPYSTAPGESLDITLYWQAQDWIETPLHLSLHALTLPDLRRSMAQVDDLLLGQIPSTAFVPGLPVRKQLRLTFDADAPDLQSYALVLRVWRGNYERDNVQGIDIVGGDRPSFTHDSIRLATVTLLDSQTFPSISAIMDYRFADHLALRGVALPGVATAGQTLRLSFRWDSLGPIQRDLTQFLHLIDADGELAFGYDQPPFGGRLPTSAWPPGAALQDDWSFLLPLDLPPGEYRVYTGLYELASLERSAVSDTGGEPVPDNAILLGTLRIVSA